LWDRRDITSLQQLLRAHHEVRAALADTIARVLNERAEAVGRAEALGS
jgi:hypothetical protein